MTSNAPSWEQLFGETIDKIFISEEKTSLLFITTKGDSYYAYTGGECCNNVYIEHMNDVSVLIGEEVLSITGVEESAEDSWLLTFCTAKGYCDVEVRNVTDDFAYSGSLTLDAKNAFPTQKIPMTEVKIDF